MDTGWSARNESVALADKHLPDVDGMKSVDVLLGIDASNYEIGVNLFREGHLHEDTVNPRIVVQRFNGRKQLRLRRVGLEPDREAVHPSLLGRLPFRIHVDLARRIVADEHHRESRLHTARGQLLHPLRNVRANLPRDRTTVDQLSGQNPLLASP